MIINGKEVTVDYKSATQIQDKINAIPNIPDNSKREVSKKEQKELIDSSSGIFESFDGYGMNNNVLLTGKKSKENRKDYYTTYQEMDESNFIHRGLQMIADDCTQKNSEGHTIKLYSDDDEIKEILEELFYSRLNIDKELWSIFYETCKMGDNFYEVIPDSYKNPTMVARIRYLEPEKVNRIEKNGKLAFYTYTTSLVDEESLAYSGEKYTKADNEKIVYRLEPWQIIHFKITDKCFHPYGGSLLKAGVKAFRRLQLLEDGMTIYRLARVPERRVFKIDCGNLPQSEANRQVQKIKDNYRTSQILDDRGNINRQASALSLTQDIFIPIRQGDSGTTIDTLQGGTALNNIDDIRYFRDQVLWTMNIPPEYLGFTSDQSGGSQGRGSLAMQDIKFSRFIERIQYSIEEGLIKIAAIELFFKKKKRSDLRNFKIELTPPSNIKELMDLEYTTQKINLIQSMLTTQLFPKKFILQYVMKMNKKEIDNLSFFKELEDQSVAAQDNAAALGGGLGMGGMSMTSPATTELPPEQPQPTASINTEELEKKMVKLFGKDILIENKEDFVKLIKAAENYNKSLKHNKKETIIKEEDSSDFIKTISNIIMYEKEVKIDDGRVMSLFVENELGGLDFIKKSFFTYLPGKKRTSMKALIYEEKEHQF